MLSNYLILCHPLFLFEEPTHWKRPWCCNPYSSIPLLWGIQLFVYLIVWIHLTAYWCSVNIFKFSFLSLTFDSFVKMCLGVNLFEFILFGMLCASWTLLPVFFPRLGVLLAIFSLNNCHFPFSLSSPSETSIIWMLFCLISSHRSLKLSLFFKIHFPFCALFGWVPFSSFRNDSLFASSSLLLNPLNFFS